MTSSLGIKKRWNRFVKSNEKSIIVPIDHGLGFGPSKGIENISTISSWINDKNINGVIAHRGILEKLISQGFTDKPFILQLSGMSITDSKANQKELLTSVEYASIIGADAVSVQSNFDGKNDRNNIKNISKVTEEARKLGFPVLAMIYNANGTKDEVKLMRHYLRIALELGVDAVKIPLYKNQNKLADIISDFTQDLDVFIAGGETINQNELLSLIKFANSQGIVGVTLGRNVFERENISNFLNKVRNCFVGK